MTSPYLDLPLFPLAVTLKAGIKALHATVPSAMLDDPDPAARNIDNWRAGFASWRGIPAGPMRVGSCSGCRGFTSAAPTISTAAPASRPTRDGQPVVPTLRLVRDVTAPAAAA